MDPLVTVMGKDPRGRDPTNWGIVPLVMGKDLMGRDPTNREIDPLVMGKVPKVREPLDLGEVPGKDANRAVNSGRRPSS